MSSEKKEDILNAATSAFLEHGYRATSMNRIALEAQVSKRTLYKYFANKEEIFTDIIDQISILLEDSNEQLSQLEDLPFEDQLVLYIDNLIKLSLTSDKHRLGKLVLSELLKDDPVHFEVIVKLYDKKNHRTQWIKQCQQDGFLIKDFTASDIQDHIEALVHGLVLYPILFKQKETISKKELKNIKKSIVHIVCRSYGMNYNE